MAFDGKEGGAISLTTAAAMTASYRDANPGELKGHFFGKEILQQLLEQEGCMGIRMYYGIDDEGEKALVLVGADSSEDDMTDLVADISTPCPSRCSSRNSLNS